MACNPLTNLSRECGKTAASGLRDEVYLCAFDSLKPISGSTEVYSVSTGGLVNAIQFITGSTKFVKYGAVKNQNAFTDTYTPNENGTYDIQKEVTFSLTNIGSIEARNAVDNLINNPVVLVLKQRSGATVIFGLNGQFSMSGAVGTVNATANGRVITMAGSDTEFTHVVDPTLLPSILA